MLPALGVLVFSPSRFRFIDETTLPSTPAAMALAYFLLSELCRHVFFVLSFFLRAAQQPKVVLWSVYAEESVGEVSFMATLHFLVYRLRNPSR